MYLSLTIKLSDTSNVYNVKKWYECTSYAEVREKVHPEWPLMEMATHAKQMNSNVSSKVM